MDLIWLGIRELHDTALQWWLRGTGDKLQGRVVLLLESESHKVILSLCCSWSWFELSGTIMFINTKQTAAGDAGSSLDPFCIANSHHLHVSIATAEKVKYETALPPWILRKYQTLASLDTCSSWLTSSKSPKAFSFPASHFLIGKRCKRRGKIEEKWEKIIQGQNVPKSKCCADCGLGVRRQQMGHAWQCMFEVATAVMFVFSTGHHLWGKMVSGKIR